jgi:hypothetical protein
MFDLWGGQSPSSCKLPHSQSRQISHPFNRELRTSSDALPQWDANKKLAGFYWLNFQQITGVEETHDLAQWEDIVKQLAESTEFQGDSLFYHLRGIDQIDERSSLVAQDGEFAFRAGRPYELFLYHFHPKSAVGGELEFTSSTPYVAFTSNPIVALDSRYDLKSVRVQVGTPSVPTSELPRLSVEAIDVAVRLRGVISVYRTSGEGAQRSREWEFDVPVVVKTNWGGLVRFGLVLGVLLAIPQLIVVLSNTGIGGVTRLGLSMLVLLFNLVGGIFVAAGIKRA